MLSKKNKQLRNLLKNNHISYDFTERELLIISCFEKIKAEYSLRINYNLVTYNELGFSILKLDNGSWVVTDYRQDSLKIYDDVLNAFSDIIDKYFLCYIKKLPEKDQMAHVLLWTKVQNHFECLLNNSEKSFGKTFHKDN